MLTMGRQPTDLSRSEKISMAGIRARIWLMKRIRRLLRPGSIVVGTIAAAYGVGALLKEEGLPSKEAWMGQHPLGVLLAVVGVLAIVGTLLVFVGYDRALRKADQNDELALACRGIWHLAVEHLGIDMTKVGVHVWAVKGVRGFKCLERRATFVLEARRSSNVVWRKGVGAVGLAWADDEPLVANVEHLAATATSERLFSEIPRRNRFGLSWREYRRSRHYRSILAIPLRRHTRVLGCLSVDVKLDGYADMLDTLSRQDQFNNVLAVCEAVLVGKA
jgi:hypothetical protein